MKKSELESLVTLAQSGDRSATEKLLHEIKYNVYMIHKKNCDACKMRMHVREVPIKKVYDA